MAVQLYTLENLPDEYFPNIGPHRELLTLLKPKSRQKKWSSLQIFLG